MNEVLFSFYLVENKNWKHNNPKNNDTNNELDYQNNYFDENQLDEMIGQYKSTYDMISLENNDSITSSQLHNEDWYYSLDYYNNSYHSEEEIMISDTFEQFQPLPLFSDESSQLLPIEIPPPSPPPFQLQPQAIKRKAETNFIHLKRINIVTKYNDNIIESTDNISVICSKCKNILNWVDCYIIEGYEKRKNEDKIVHNIICEDCITSDVKIIPKVDKKCPRCTYKPIVDFVNEKRNQVNITCEKCVKKMKNYKKPH